MFAAQALAGQAKPAPWIAVHRSSGYSRTPNSKTATFRSLCFRESYNNLGYGAYPTSIGIGGKTLHNGRVVSPRAVSDSRNSKPCLDPDVSQSVLGIILGGGAGTRLYPLTKNRAKPAVPLGANYRLIDIPVSNCINSNITKVYVLTQFNSASLNRHISQAYDGNTGNYRNEGFVEVLAAQQSPENPNWFQGTADAVRQYLWLLDEHPVMEFLILAGDHLYRMDYQNFIRTHRESHADITVAALPVDEKRAGSLGLMKIDNEGRIIEFVEKPKGEKLKAMGVQAYLFDGYWEDIGTIDAFYNANLRLTMRPVPDFSFYDSLSPIYTKKRFLPPSKVLDAELTDCLIGEGCILKNCKIIHSVVGLRSWIEDGAIIEDSLLMGADYYETDEERSAIVAKNGVQIGIGRNTHVRRAIIDKNVRIGDNVKIINADNVQEADREIDGYFIKSGIVTVIKNALIPSGTII
ncbi:glucose-1-phosphate adenylyltransferase small subunit, chloroplastic/amyloplastic isoform X2 [Cryptomeria japonica]|uniref:glucose-1-phosphate adenylyltransferase small subunit, chloroplastic/amyloplastic isoform X2 n=1 Tax=Cryptomeria japonica TaxID=3369 RepID=UPI0027DA5B40|nr:glucose-1-phosphate adenylyltransferase small subunit, chloroplastic/amyloplastic isoform X2 [Cryptomeria japonica]